MRESVELLSNFSEVTGQGRYDPRLQRQGYLWCTTDPARAEWQRDLVHKQHTWGQSDIEHLGGDEVRNRFPYVSPEVLAARYPIGVSAAANTPLNEEFPVCSMSPAPFMLFTCFLAESGV